jgi:hypothetical protein
VTGTGTVIPIRDDEATWPDLAPELDGAPLAKITKGEYQARVTDAAVRQLFNTRRLVLTFTILSTKYAGTRIPFICLFSASRVSPTSRFYRAWIVANGGQKPRRGDRLSLAVFMENLPRAFRSIGTLSRLSRAAERLADRLDQLDERLQAADETAWTPYLETVTALTALLPQLTPERRGALLTTAEMAARLQVTPKTLLKRKANREIRPALQRGKLIRWRGDEVLDGNGNGNRGRK